MVLEQGASAHGRAPLSPPPLPEVAKAAPVRGHWCFTGHRHWVHWVLGTGAGPYISRYILYIPIYPYISLSISCIGFCIGFCIGCIGFCIGCIGFCIGFIGFPMYFLHISLYIPYTYPYISPIYPYISPIYKNYT